MSSKKAASGQGLSNSLGLGSSRPSLVLSGGTRSPDVAGTLASHLAPIFLREAVKPQHLQPRMASLL